MKKLSKILLLLLVFGLVFVTTACGKGKGDKNDPSNSSKEGGEGGENGSLLDSKKSEVEQKMDNIVKTTGFEIRFIYIDDEFIYGGKGDIMWVGDGEYMTAIDTTKKALFSSENGEPYEFFAYDTEGTYTKEFQSIVTYLFSGYQYEDIPNWKSIGNKKIAGRDCKGYEYSTKTIGASSTVTYYFDKETGLCFENKVKAQAGGESADITLLSVTSYTTNPTVPTLPAFKEPIYAKSSHASEWFTYGNESFVDVWDNDVLPSFFPKQYSGVENVYLRYTIRNDENVEPFGYFDGEHGYFLLEFDGSESCYAQLKTDLGKALTISCEESDEWESSFYASNKDWFAYVEMSQYGSYCGFEVYLLKNDFANPRTAFGVTLPTFGFVPGSIVFTKYDPENWIDVVTTENDAEKVYYDIFGYTEADLKAYYNSLINQGFTLDMGEFADGEYCNATLVKDEIYVDFYFYFDEYSGSFKVSK